VLACWRAGVLACWRAGVLACWRAGVLACWRALCRYAIANNNHYYLQGKIKAGNARFVVNNNGYCLRIY
jgi:hypothetical protein